MKTTQYFPLLSGMNALPDSALATSFSEETTGGKISQNACPSDMKSTTPMQSVYLSDTTGGKISQNACPSDVKSTTPMQSACIQYTVSDSFQKLCDIQNTALSLEPKPDFSAALKSEELKGKLCGLYPDKKTVPPPDEYPFITVEFVEKEGEKTEK